LNVAKLEWNLDRRAGCKGLPIKRGILNLKKLWRSFQCIESFLSSAALTYDNQRSIDSCKNANESSGYHIVNAAELKKDFDTLKGPPQLLQFRIPRLMGRPLHPARRIKIPFH